MHTVEEIGISTMELCIKDVSNKCMHSVIRMKKCIRKYWAHQSTRHIRPRSDISSTVRPNRWSAIGDIISCL